MGRKKPFIIVTADYDYDKNISLVKNSYCEALIEGGAVPVILPLTTNIELYDEYVEHCDGLMVIGGPDINAEYYGEVNMPCNGAISPYRDVMELEIIKKIALAKKPILGICRGIQAINVAMGGTLYQDINEQVKNIQLIKHGQNAPRWHATHKITIKENSIIWSSFNSLFTSVNTFHHQAVKDIAPNFEVTAWSEDGIIEAIEHKSENFIVGVQWHPEDMWKIDAIHLEIFKKFITACKNK